MRAVFAHALLIDDGDVVRAADRGEPVRHNDRRAPAAELFERRLNGGLGHAVERARRLVEHEDRRIFQKHARNGDALLLSAGEHRSALADERIVSLRHFHDLVVDGREHRRACNLLVRCAGAAVADIFAHGVGKEEHVLLDDADVPVQRGLRDGAHILPVHKDLPAGHIVKPRQELAERRLAAPRRPDERERFARRDREIHMAQHLFAVPVMERHVPVLHAAFYVFKLLGVRRVLHVRLGAHDLQKPEEAGAPLLELLDELRELSDRRHKHRNVQRKRDEIDRVHFAPQDEQAAGGERHELHERHGKFGRGVEGAENAVIAFFDLFEFLVGCAELVHGVLLVGERLDGADAGNARLHGGVDLGGLALHVQTARSQPQTQPHHNREHQRQQKEKDQRKLPADRGENGKRPGDREKGLDHGLRAVVGKLGDIEKIGRHAGHELAGAVLIKEGERERLHLGKNILAHVRLNAHAELVAVHGHDILRERPQQIRAEKPRHQQEKGFV